MAANRRPPAPGAPGRGSSRTRTGQGKPPARPEPRRRVGSFLPEVVTVRTLVLSVVVLLAVVLLLPTVRAYVNQTGDLRDLRGQLAQAQADRKDLEVELARWDDRNYVIQQARDHQNFIMPGDTPWRVLDPQTVVDDTNPSTGQSLTDGPIRDFDAGTPWYESIWDSVQLAGTTVGASTPPRDDPPSPAPTPTGDNG